MFLCEHQWGQRGTNFAIFQRCRHRFQRTEADIQLRTQFPGRNPPMRMNELIKALIISWAAWNIACLSHRCRHCWNTPPTASLCSHPLFGLRKRSASVLVCKSVHFYPHGGTQRHTSTSSPLLMSDAILSDCPSAAICRTATKLTNYWRKGSTSTAITPASASEVAGQHNKIQGITFGAPLVFPLCFLKKIRKLGKPTDLLATCFHALILHGLFFYPENGGDIFLRYVDWLSTDYTLL
jgi:hypothetical protein